MAAYRLQRWSVGHYAATEVYPAYAVVTLDGTRAHGFLRRHTVQHCDQLRVNLLPTDTASAQGSKALVKRAMSQSADRWKGKP
jgi:hypothetical protein